MTGKKNDYMSEIRNSLARATSVVVVTVFLGVLGWYLFLPGYRWTRLVVLVVLGALAVVGAAGVWYQRKRVVAGGAVGLLLLTVTLAGSLWMFILPVIVVLVAASIVMSNDDRTDFPSLG